MTFNVLIVEDQDMPRELFGIYIRQSSDFALAGSIPNAAGAPEFCRRHPVDLILMDVITELGHSGLDAAEEIKRTFPHIKIIIVTSMPEYSWLERARNIGVDSFWYKDGQQETILQVMRRTMAGERLYPDDTPLIPLGKSSNHEFSTR
ncbi:MAG: response regulator transcription factor [Clostridia bacterium]|nr:response regulator transcription factor [Clostridia bacterium]